MEGLLSKARLHARLRGSLTVRTLASSLLATIGFILSPFSWWNDAVVNIPLALALASIVGQLTGISVSKLFVAFYWLSNIAGVLLMLLGMKGVGSLDRRGLAEGVVVSLVLTVLVYMVIS